MKKYTLGVPLLVKDEINKIDRCLDSIVPYVDEVIIFDTGSTDGTLERLQLWAAAWPEKVWLLECPWTGDFSDMRNRVQAHCRSDFLFIVDADEWFPNPNKGTSKDPWILIRQCLQEQGDQMDAAFLLLYNHLPENQVTEGDSTYSLRIFRNNPEIKWEGRVHNQIQQGIANNPRNGESVKIVHILVVLEHDGYKLPRPEAIAKYEKRLPLLHEEIAQHKEEGNAGLLAYYQWQLANGLYMCDRLDECKQAFDDLVWEDLENNNQYSSAILASALAIATLDTESGKLWTERALQLQPEQPIALLHKATIFQYEKNYLDAYVFAAAAIALNRDQSIMKSHFLDEEYCAGLAAEACFGAEMFNEAVMFARMCLSKYPGHARMMEIDAACTNVIRETFLAAFTQGELENEPNEA